MAENVLLASLSEAERERIAPYLEKIRLELRDNLLETGEQIPYVWFPEDAVTSTLVETPDGLTIEVGLTGAEGMVGLPLVLGVDRSYTSVIAQVDGWATRMRADDFVAHVVQPRGELYRLLLRFTNAFMAMIAQTAACNSLHTIDARTARWILMTHDRVDRDTFPLTQEFLAFMLGVRRPSVSTAASALQQAGCIRYTRGSITVTDRVRLQQHVCPCYSIIRSLTENFAPASLA